MIKMVLISVLSQHKTLLEKQGKTADFIESLLLDAQKWNDSRSLLHTQVHKAKEMLRDFNEKRYLCDEEKDSQEALEKLSKIIDTMDTEVEIEIETLIKKTESMIELVSTFIFRDRLITPVLSTALGRVIQL